MEYEIFNNMTKEEQDKYKKICGCNHCICKNNENGLYQHCAHFSVCATDKMQENKIQ